MTAAEGDPSRWQHRELTVPLELTVPADETPAMLLLMIRREAEEKIEAHLQHAGHDGWRPAEPTELGALWLAGRVKVQAGPRRAFGVLSPNTWRFESVTIYVRRLVG
jgi:hypothetical protein